MRGMSRRRVPIVPGVPYHVTHRSAHQKFILEGNSPKRMLSSRLAEWAKRERVTIHAFALMDNHFHLTATECSAGSIERMVGRAAQEFSCWLNAENGTHGPNWEKRFYASPMDAAHAISAAAYIERNPVAAGLVKDAWSWHWSSAAFHVGLGPRPRLLIGGEHPPDGMSHHEWMCVLSRPVREELCGLLHSASYGSRVLADQDWVCATEAALGVRLRPPPIGRPRRATVEIERDALVGGSRLREKVGN